MNNELYLDTYILQQDMRIRMPKQIIANLDIKPGKTFFDIYVDSSTNNIVLKKSTKESEK